MTVSRRNLLQGAGIGVALASLGKAASASVVDNPSLAPKSRQIPDDKSLQIISLDRLELQAQKVLSDGAYAFISGGAGDEWTLHENRRAFSDFPILTHRLVGISAKQIDLTIDLLGHKLPYPILSSPAGVHTFAHPDGEIASAAGVGAAGTIFQSSGASAKPLEAIAKAGAGPKWFQLYFNADLGVTRSLLDRARAAGYTAIMVTADALGPGASDQYVSMGRPLPEGFTFGNHDPRYGGMGNFKNQKIDLTPADIEFVRTYSGLPVVVKGIMRGADADEAIKAGASAIQVSNHGGRQLDGVPAAITVLPDVVAHVQKRVPVIFDSGIRRGIDVFRAISLGADAVALARPMLYGLSVGGVKGVQSVFEHLRDELHLAMLLAGVQSVKALSLDNLKKI